MAKNTQVVLPSNLEKFLRSGTGQSYDKDETLSDLLHYRGRLAGGDQYPDESTRRMTSVCLDLEVRLAGALLLQAAQNIQLGHAPEARQALDRAVQLLDQAFTKAEAAGLLLTIRRNDQVEAVAVINQQLQELEQAPTKVTPAPGASPYTLDQLHAVSNAMMEEQDPGDGTGRMVADQPLSEAEIAAEFRKGLAKVGLPSGPEDDGDLIACFLNRQALDYCRAEPMYTDTFWRMIHFAALEAQFQEGTLPLTRHQLKCGNGPQMC